MSTIRPLTRDIGQAERTLQALLHRRLLQARVTFPEWVVLTLLSAGSRLPDSELVAKLREGKIADSTTARDLIASMIDAGSIASADGQLSLSETGMNLFRPLREAIEGITHDLFAAVPPADLEATRRTLIAVTNRANQLLSADGA